MAAQKRAEMEHIVVARGLRGPHGSAVHSSQALCLDSAGNPFNKRQE